MSDNTVSLVITSCNRFDLRQSLLFTSEYIFQCDEDDWECYRTEFFDNSLKVSNNA